MVILGPTGAGKSELGLVLAEAFGGEIIGCDSIQVYRGLDIGSAKISPSRRRGIRHHLIDVIELDEQLTAGAYSRLAREAVQAVQSLSRLPIVVGGTGFYLRALLDGLSPAPERDENLRRRLTRLARERRGVLDRFLRKHDPSAAARIHPNDHQKLIRAIEMIWLTGQPATEIQSLSRDSIRGVETLKIGLNPDRSELYRRLDERSAGMFHGGLLSETRALLDRGFSSELKPLQSLGYRQAVKVLTAKMPLEEAVEECQTKTRQYAKRQLTWFRRDPDVHWLQGFGTQELIQNAAVELTRGFLSSVKRSGT